MEPVIHLSSSLVSLSFYFLFLFSSVVLWCGVLCVMSCVVVCVRLWCGVYVYSGVWCGMLNGHMRSNECAVPKYMGTFYGKNHGVVYLHGEELLAVR